MTQFTVYLALVGEEIHMIHWITKGEVFSLFSLGGKL